MSNKTGNDNLIYLTDLTFTNVNRIFVLFLKMEQIESLFLCTKIVYYSSIF